MNMSDTPRPGTTMISVVVPVYCGANYLEALTAALEPGDIAISMLPADQHVGIAKACLSKNANFVSSSYIAPEMRALDAEFKAKGLVSVNEVGLDPGIDHLMAHDLVARYRPSPAYHADNVLSFTSYCGGVPKIANPFKYKFSWAPVGVLKALRSPSRSLRDFKEFKVDRPWNAITSYDAPLPTPESFEVYPNRDSYPFMEDYRFDKTWKVKDFVRGTIRLNGWAKAWDPVFKEIETLSGPSGDQRLAEMAAEFLKDNAYAPGEPDRDFLVSGPRQHGIPGLVNLFGIESPGLTSCLALAEHAVGELDLGRVEFGT